MAAYCSKLRFAFALKEIWILKLNGSKHIKVCAFLLKNNNLLHQFIAVEFTEVINSGDSLINKTRMDPK